jgi:hypothetical protein
MRTREGYEKEGRTKALTLIFCEKKNVIEGESNETILRHGFKQRAMRTPESSNSSSKTMWTTEKGQQQKSY